jgi:amino acid adenylation domain-containing protein
MEQPGHDCLAGTPLSPWYATLAEPRPDAPAVDAGQEKVSYAELDRRSDACAAALVDHGVTTETVVAVAMERTPLLIATLLGIWKAGGAYLPIDVDHPAERRRYILEDSGASLLVTDRASAVLHPELPVVFAEALEQGAPTGAPVTCAVSGASLAYVIYTSGSTGRPKGVEITHASLENFLESMRAVPGISPADRVLAHTTICFDISILELWGTLSAGAVAVLASRGEAADARRLAAIIEQRAATIVQATPTSWSLLLGAGLRSLRGVKVLTGGEPLPRDLAARLQAAGAEVWNMYGPTETTVWSSLCRIEGDGPITIGRPIGSTNLDVRGQDGERLADGDTGELWIGGAGVARGYRNRPELTADRYRPDPGGAPGSRAFRSGDLARMLPDGRFECFGRIDDQLKIDGYRIEPGEIEKVLRAVPGVSAVAIVVAEQAPGDRRLVAYTVAENEPVPAAVLGREAGARLPRYMVPAAFVTVPFLPRTPGGKVDRRALPVPDWSGRSAGALPEDAPRTPTEQALADIWRQVLGIPAVGIHGNFFEIGGRSRLGAQVFGLIADRLGKVLPLAALFSAPTIAGLAALVDGDSGPESWSPLIPIRATRPGMGQPLFCVHPLGGHVLTYRDLARRLGPDVPVYGLQAAGLDGRRPPLSSVEDMAEHYLAEIRQVQRHGPYALGGFSFGGLVAFEMARRLTARGEGVSLLALLDTQFPEGARSPFVRHMAGSAWFRRLVYPQWLRVAGHRASLERLGPRRYAALLLGKLPGRTSVARIDAVEAYLREEQPFDGPDAFSRAAARVVDANAGALTRYIPQPYAGVITFFHALATPVGEDTRELWASVADRLEVHDVPGSHSDIRMEPQVSLVADVIRQAMLPSSLRHDSAGATGSADALVVSA